MKKLLIVAASLSALLLAGCSDKEVASVSLGVFKAAVRDLGGVTQINQCLIFSIKDSADSQSFKEDALRFLKNNLSVGAFIDAVDHGLSNLAGQCLVWKRREIPLLSKQCFR